MRWATLILGNLIFLACVCLPAQSDSGIRSDFARGFFRQLPGLIEKELHGQFQHWSAHEILNPPFPFSMSREAGRIQNIASEQVESNYRKAVVHLSGRKVDIFEQAVTHVLSELLEADPDSPKVMAVRQEIQGELEALKANFESAVDQALKRSEYFSKYGTLLMVTLGTRERQGSGGFIPMGPRVVGMELGRAIGNHLSTRLMLSREGEALLSELSSKLNPHRAPVVASHMDFLAIARELLAPLRAELESQFHSGLLHHAIVPLRVAFPEAVSESMKFEQLLGAWVSGKRPEAARFHGVFRRAYASFVRKCASGEGCSGNVGPGLFWEQVIQELAKDLKAEVEWALRKGIPLSPSWLLPPTGADPVACEKRL